MAELVRDPVLMVGEGWDAYRLLDSGHGRKFEQYGAYRFIRPEPQAMWSPRLSEWDAHGEFVPGSDEDGGGRWQFAQDVPLDGWTLGWATKRVLRPNARRSAISASSPTWPRCGNGWAGNSAMRAMPRR